MDSYEPDTTIGVEGYQEQNESQISENTVNSLGDFQHETSTPAGLPRATHLIRTFRIAAILALSHSLHSLSIPPAAPDINNFAVKNEKEDTTSYIKLATNLINKKYEKKQKRDIWSESEMKNISKLENDDIGKVGEEIINSFCNKANINSNIDGTKTKQIGGGIGDGKINLINFFEGYPTKTVILDVSALSKVMNKVESISELLTFFTNSPLEKIKTN